MNIHQQALEQIERNKWDVAHRLIQDCSDPFSYRIHGYLHRIEGDLSNARYWYRRAGCDMPANTLDQEFELLLLLLKSNNYALLKAKID